MTKIPFNEELEFTIDEITYYVSTAGIREWDEEERMFTSLSKLNITDEFDGELTDTDDVYNVIKELILHSIEPELEIVNNEEETG